MDNREIGTRIRLARRDAGLTQEKLAEQLCRKEVVIATETGCGVVPIDAAEREAREAAGRLSILLAKRAQKVIRVWCGLPESLR